MSKVVLTEDDLNFCANIVGQIKAHCTENGRVNLVKLGLLIAHINYILNYASTLTVLDRMIKKIKENE